MTRKLRGLLISPGTWSVAEVVIADTLSGLYGILSYKGQPTIDDINGVLFDRDHYLWIDGEGFLKPDVPVFRIKGYHHPLAGLGLVLGIDEAGSNQSAMLFASDLLARIEWTKQLTTGQLGPSEERPGYFKIGDPILKDAPPP